MELQDGEGCDLIYVSSSRRGFTRHDLDVSGLVETGCADRRWTRYHLIHRSTSWDYTIMVVDRWQVWSKWFENSFTGSPSYYKFWSRRTFISHCTTVWRKIQMAGRKKNGILSGIWSTFEEKKGSTSSILSAFLDEIDYSTPAGAGQSSQYAATRKANHAKNKEQAAFFWKS